jgi:glutamate carboxypeptidase
VRPATGDHVVARWGGATPEQPGLLILCHIDTVWDLGTLERQPCAERDGRLYGPGAYDMKAGVVIVLHALAALRELGRWPDAPLTVLLTSDEERGSRTSRALIEDEARRSRQVFCMEPALSNGAVKTFRKGTGLYHVNVQGRASHAGADHQAGVNAIEESPCRSRSAHDVYERGTTLNVGVSRAVRAPTWCLRAPKAG